MVEGTEKELREGEIKGRQSKDTKVNKESRKIIECIEDIGWGIFNRNIKEYEGEFTFTEGRRNTVIE